MNVQVNANFQILKNIIEKESSNYIAGTIHKR